MATLHNWLLTDTIITVGYAKVCVEKIEYVKKKTNFVES